MFAKLNIQNWRQFESVDIDFHPRLTVLTGANGSGKTTLLHLLNRHWGWNVHFVSSPHPSRKLLKEYWAGFWGDGENGNGQASIDPRAKHLIGEVTYRSGRKAKLEIPKAVKEVFDVTISPLERISGVFVPSHRAPYVFRKIDQIPIKLDAKERIFEVYLSELKSHYTGSGRDFSPNYQIKRSLISLATFGYGNEAVERDEEAVNTYEGFEKILRIMLPSSLGFNDLKIKVPDVLLSTNTGDIAFDAVSGGVAAIIDMAWQIHMYSRIHEEFVVVIDEPEAHLHPALQQRLVPDLLRAFPRSQFIIATHSPFMVTSEVDSNVYVLRYNESNRVESTLLRRVNKAGTVDEILMDVLGVPSTLPQWAATKIETVLGRFIKVPISAESIESLRTELTALGMQHMFPEMLARVAEGQR